MFESAAIVVRVSTVEILSKLKTSLGRSYNQKATCNIRKSRTLAKTISREKRKIMGYRSTIPKSADETKENLPNKFVIISTDVAFMPVCDFIDDQKKSDHGGWVL
jgi:hypothetical protein